MLFQPSDSPAPLLQAPVLGSESRRMNGLFKITPLEYITL